VIKCDPIADHSLEHEFKEFISTKKPGGSLPPPSAAYETLKIVEEIYRTNKI
jgi:hypothetical protein